MKKKLTSILLSAALAVGCLAHGAIFNSRTASADEELMQTASPYTGTTYTHSSVFNGLNIYNGIDVSKYNTSVDWEKVKAAGIDFVFIRIGYRGYGSSGRLCADSNFESYITGALEAGLEVGVYYFTQATNTTEAKEEAAYCIEKLSDYKITLPVVLDYEFPNTGNGYTGGRMYDAKLSKSAATNNCKAFCNAIQEAGYTPMIYANKTDLTNTINGASLGKSYKIWLANYNAKSTYTGTYEFWQYTEKGKVDGISGNVDCNFWYTDTIIETPNNAPTDIPSPSPSVAPTVTPSVTPTVAPTATPSVTPTATPADTPSPSPTVAPTNAPSPSPTDTIKISKAKVASISPITYTGSEIMPLPKLTYNNRELILDADYTLNYQNNIDIGKATITITGLGSFTGTKDVKFNIRPPKVTSFKTTSTKNTVTLTWNQNTYASGYQIWRKAIYNGETYEKVKTYKYNTKVKLKNTGLEADREYYYRIRSYTTVGTTKYYSDYTYLTAATLPGNKKATVTKKTKLYALPDLSGKYIIAIPKKTKITYLGRTYVNDETQVYHLKYTVNGKSYTGYAPITTKLSF